MRKSETFSTFAASTIATIRCSFVTYGPATNLSPNFFDSLGISSPRVAVIFRITEFADGHWSGAWVISSTSVANSNSPAGEHFSDISLSVAGGGRFLKPLQGGRGHARAP